jgi:hypothetical protein
MVPNRFFQRIFLWLLIAVFVAGSGSSSTAQNTSPAPSPLKQPGVKIQAPAEEQLAYDIAFLWFNRFGEAGLSLLAGAPGIWHAKLEARTLGVAAWVTRDRVQRYRSKMDMQGRGQFRSLSFDSDILKTKDGERKSRIKRYLFNYDKRQILKQIIRNGQPRPDEMIAMPASTPNDVLTAFYNFRRGVFGEIRPGKQYRIPTLERDAASEIIVDIFAQDQRPADRRFPSGGMLARVKLDPEILDTRDGIVYIWFDERQRPALILIENVIGLGDVRCTLREVEKKS